MDEEDRIVFRNIQSSLPAGVWLLSIRRLPSVDHILPLKFIIETNLGDFVVQTQGFWEFQGHFSFVLDTMSRIRDAILKGYTCHAATERAENQSSCRETNEDSFVVQDT